MLCWLRRRGRPFEAGWAGRRPSHFLDKTDSEIATRIASEARLLARVDATAPARRVVIQRNLTDWEFLVQLAQRNGFRVWMDERERILHFRRAGSPPPPPVARDPR